LPEEEPLPDVVLLPELELLLEPEPMELDIDVMEDISALEVAEAMDVSLDICVMEDMSALMVLEEK